jgi:tetratricopeptide (TPR) repeat protein
MEDHRLSKVEILIQQKKYREAEQIIGDLLREEPNNIQFLYFLTEIYLSQEKLEDATTIANQAIGLAPDEPSLLHLKARIALMQDDYDEALELILDALELDPQDPDYFAFLAHIYLIRKDYESALQYADEALELDPEHIFALNTRSKTLLKLKKDDEAFQTIENALREDPTNTYTHANYGWNLLERGDHKKALNHFKESLSNNPNNEYAQAGMLEAIKASNPVYKAFLKYSFWMGNLTANYQWAVILGFYFGVRILRAIANANTALQPFLTPLIIVLSLFAFSTWVIKPISNLFLRFNVYGKLLLDKKEKMSSNFVAASLGIFLTGVILYFIFSNDFYLGVALYGFAMMVPCSVMFEEAKYKNAFLIYTIAMAIIGLASLMVMLTTGVVINNFSILFFISFIGFQWVANYLLIRKDNL